MSGNWLEDNTVGDKKIRSLTADKITAGTIDANIINVINLKAENITAGYISADRIKAGSITIGKLNDDVAKGLNLLENTVFASFASDTNSTLGSYGTAIQQNAQEISLQATSITNLGQDIARVDVKADNISLVVGGYDGKSGLVGDVGDLDYDMYNRYGKISLMEDEIDLRVKDGDVIAAINLSPERITIDAERIDLRGVTSIYGDDNSEARFEGYGDFTIYNGNNTIFRIYNNVGGISISSYRNYFLSVDSHGVYADGVWEFTGTVDFTRANIIGL